ncbi:MAG: hypothetical protein V3V04_00870, partial [Rhizobiaceae bacterium]
MKTVFISALFSLMLFAIPSAIAQDHQSYQIAQANYEVFIDGRGRHFLVDPDTGEVVGRANRNARFTYRDKKRAEAAYRRQNRRRKLNQRFGKLFDILKGGSEGKTRFKKNKKKLRRNKQLAKRRDGKTRTQSLSKRREPLPQISQEEEIARLPDYDQPVAKTPKIRGMRKPKFNKSQMTSLQIF